MAKSKYAPALFEVINARQDPKTGSKVSLPKWWKRSAAPDQPAPETDPGGLTPEPSQPAEAAVSAPNVEEPAATAEIVAVRPVSPIEPLRRETAPLLPVGDELVDAPPLVQVRAGRVALSLNPVSVAVVCGVALIALFTSYQLGRRSANAAASRAAAATVTHDEVDRLVNGPAKPEVIKPPAPRAKTAATPGARSAASPADAGAARNSPVQPTPPAARAAGRYVLLESFAADHEQAAQFARQWLSANGYPTVLEKRASAWRLVSVDSFADEGAARKYMEAVPRIGQKLGSALGKAGLPIYYMTKPLQIRKESNDSN